MSLVVCKGAMNGFIKMCKVSWLLIILSSCSGYEKQEIRIGTNLWIGYEPMYLAEKKGLFRDDLVTLVELPTSNQVASALQHDLIDLAALTLDEVMKLQAMGGDYLVLMAFDYSYGGDHLLSQPEITHVNQLRGQKVGLEAGAVGEYLLYRALQRHQLTMGDVEIIPIHVDGHLRAYQQGQVAAISTFEPTATWLINAGARSLFDSSHIPEEIVDVLVVKREKLVEISPYLSIVFDGWFAALKLLKEEEAVAFFAARSELEPEAIIQILQHVYFPTREENVHMIYAADPSLLRQVQRIDTFLSLGLSDLQRRQYFPTYNYIEGEREND